MEDEEAPSTEHDALLKKHSKPNRPPRAATAGAVASARPSNKPTDQHAANAAVATDSVPTRPQALTQHRRVFSTTSTIQRPDLRGHFRNKSSLRQIMDEDIIPGLQHETDLFRGTLRKSLVEANSGRTFFLDMSMTRSLSILPEAIPDLVEETVGKIPPVKHLGEHEVPPQSIALQYLSLFTAVVAVSSNGTVLALLDGVAPALKLYWRMTVTGVLLLCLALPHLLQHGWPEDMKAWPKIASLACAAACFASQGLCFVNAMELTSIGNVVIGANSQAILLVLGKLIIGESVHWMEGAGVVLAFVGCIMCAQDEAREKGEEVTTETTFFERSSGELLAFSAGIFGVFYLILAKSIRPHMPVSLFVACVMILGSTMVIPFCYMSDPDVTWGMDADHGFFGWTDVSHVLIIVHIALVCNLLGTVGFVRAMQFFDNLIIAVATLLEPLIATIIAFILGVGLLPGPLGWLGNLVVVIGTLGVVIPSIGKEGEGTH